MDMSETFEVAGHSFTMEIVAVVRVSCDECGDSELVAIEVGMETHHKVKDWAEAHQHFDSPTVAEYIAMGKVAAESLKHLQR
jgi:hypothetical protein